MDYLLYAIMLNFANLQYFLVILCVIEPLPDFSKLEAFYYGKKINYFVITPGKIACMVKKDLMGQNKEKFLKEKIYYHRVGSSNSKIDYIEMMRIQEEFNKYLTLK